MKRIISAIVTLVMLAGCHITDGPLNLTRTTSGHKPLISGEKNHAAGELAPESTAARIEQPASVVTRGSDGTLDQHVSPVAYQAGEIVEIVPIPGEPLPFSGGEPVSNLALFDLEGMAMQNNPAVAQAAAMVRAARGNWTQVGLPPNFVLGYSGQQLGSRGQAEQQGVYVGQEFITGRKLKLNRQVAAWEIQKLQRDLDATRLRVHTDVRISYYNVLIAQQQRDVATELVRLSGEAVEAAEALFKGEEVSQADPLRARLQSDTAGILLQNAINQHLEAWRRLAAVVGIPDLELQRLEGDLKPEDLNITWEEQLQRLLNDSPELAAAMADVESACWAVKRAYAEVHPNVDVQAIVQDDRGTGSRNGNLQVSLPIPLWNRNQGGIRKARAEVTAAHQRVDRLALQLQARLATVFQQYESARNQVEQYSREDGILDKSQRTLDLIRTGYQSGEFAVLDLLAAQQTYFRTNLDYLDSLRELWVSVMQINGLLLQNSLVE